ncbi:hypothetical protein ACFL6Y_10155 [Elusimicrobiota bacterium]
MRRVRARRRGAETYNTSMRIASACWLLSVVLLSAAPKAESAQEYETIVIDCADPEQVRYYEEEVIFDPPREEWKDCVDNQEVYAFKCRVHEEFGYICLSAKKGLRLGEDEGKDDEPGPADTKQAAKARALKLIQPLAPPPIAAKEETTEQAGQEESWFKSLWKRISAWFAG